jgi:FkbM family methyltransferase
MAPRTEAPATTLDCAIGYNRFGAYCVPRSSHHRPAAQAILRSKVWEPETLGFLVSISGNIVHAGTFFGDFIPALAQRDGHVWALEPNRENFRCAQVTVALNGLTNVTLMHGALDAMNGEGHLQVVDARGRPLGGASHLATGGEVVPLLTIDSIVEGPISVIQLDVEGNEQRALSGAMKTIEENLPILVLETAPSDAWFARELAPLGYREALALGPNRVFRTD